jgi:hypothetical protein
MQISNTPQVIFHFFSKKNRKKLRDEFIAFFNMSSSGFYSKIREGGFTGEEQLWLQTWAKANGMPLLDDNQKSKPSVEG